MGYKMKRGGKPKFKDLGSNKSLLNNTSPLKHHRTFMGYTVGHVDWDRVASVADDVATVASYAPFPLVSGPARAYKLYRGVKTVDKAIDAYKSYKKVENVKDVRRVIRQDAKSKTSTSKKSDAKTTNINKGGQGGKGGKDGKGLSKTKKAVIKTTIALTLAEMARRAAKKKIARETSRNEYLIGEQTKHFDKWIKHQQQVNKYNLPEGGINQLYLERNTIYDQLNTELDPNYKPGSALRDEDKDRQHDLHKLTISRKKMSKMLSDPKSKYYNKRFQGVKETINAAKHEHNVLYPHETFKDTLPDTKQVEFDYVIPKTKK